MLATMEGAEKGTNAEGDNQSAPVSFCYSQLSNESKR